MGIEHEYVNPIPDQVARKSITFAGGTTHAIGDHDGSGDPATVFTVTGRVHAEIVAICTTNLAFDTNATIELGIVGNTACIIEQTDLTVEAMIAEEIWHDATPDSEFELWSVAKDCILTDGNDVILTVGTANVNSGVILFVCIWTPLSAGASVVAA